MFNSLTRWALFTSIITFALAYYGVYEGALQAILVTAHPAIPLGLLGVVYGNLIYFGYQAWLTVKQPGYVAETEAGFFWAEVCMGVALAGTVLGMMQVFAVFQNINVNDFKGMITKVGSGTSTAQITLFMGVVGAITIRLAMALTFGAYQERKG